MFLNGLSKVFLLLNLIRLAYSIENAYEVYDLFKEYPFKEVKQNAAALQVGTPSKITTMTPIMDCGLRCVLEPLCQVFTITTDNLCTLYSNETTLFSLADSWFSTAYGQGEIKGCVDSESYADLGTMTCVKKYMNEQPCNGSEQCSDSKGLACASNKCQCDSNK